MPLYQIINSDKRLRPFHSSELGSRYLEKDLENWLEANPQVLVSDEPLLIIGRQVSTPVGIIDLLALDAEGAIVVVELKRAPNQRSTIAQSLEYAAWLCEINQAKIIQIADTYLKQKNGFALAQAWQQVFDSELPNLSPDAQHRIFVVIEGENDKLTSVVNYLRNAGVDISLLSYNFYRTESDDEILDIEKIIGDDEKITPSDQGGTQVFPSEMELLEKWRDEVKQAYQVFKDKVVQNNLVYSVKKTQVSYRKITKEGRLFICGFHGSGRNFKIWLRSDTLSSIFDFQAVANEIRSETDNEIEILHTDVWFVITYPASVKRAEEAADLVINKIACRID
jgi:Holliday junction resolvase-like predicted endonuclease